MHTDRFNVVVQVLDCLRLDRFREAMPLTQAAIRDFAILDNHWAVAHCSDPNHWALFHSEGPWHSKVWSQMGAAFTHVSANHLAWQLKHRLGYHTCAVEPIKVPKFYLLFDDIAWHPTGQSSDPDLRALRAMLAEARQKSGSDQPFFYFGRSMTCHYPYLDQPMPPRGSVADGSRHDIIPLYDAAVAHEDKFVANLVEYILSEHPNTVIVLLADHGELLGEHGAWDHLYTLWNILVRTPAAIYVPGSKSKRTDRPTSHLDIAPTIYDLVNLTWRGEASRSEGQSLAPWLWGTRPEPTDAHRLLWLQGTGAGPGEEGDALDPVGSRVLWRHRGVVRGQTKVVEDIRQAADGKLYRDMVATETADYGEGSIRVVGRPAVASGEPLAKWLPPVPQYHPFEVQAVEAIRDRRIETLVLERLRALGYA